MKDKAIKQEGVPQRERAVLAQWVIGGSVIGMIIFAAAMIFSAKAGETGIAAEKAFTMVIPLFGTWMGTVLAFYFAGTTYEAANQNVSNLVEQVIDTKLRKISVKEAMIPVAAMQYVTLTSGDDDGSSIKLQEDVINRLKDPVTRLPVLSSGGVAMYIVHQSLVYKYITMKTIEAAKRSQAFDVNGQTLKSFLDFDDMKEMVSRTIAFVSLNDTLADAKNAMERIRDCQDVLVTDDGNRAKPVRGWLTNVDISRQSKA